MVALRLQDLGHERGGVRVEIDAGTLLVPGDLVGLARPCVPLPMREDAGRPDHLNRMITQAMAHRGFSYLHILSPCVTFDKTHRTYQNLGMQVRDLPADHDPTDRLAAMREAMHDETPALGLYFSEERPTLGDALDGLVEKAGGELPGKVAAKPARKTARR